MASTSINVLITSFDGLGLPPTLNLVRSPATRVDDILKSITTQLPNLHTRIAISTIGGRTVEDTALPIEALSGLDGHDFISLRLSVPLCGGKGGFGSQLRAAGGRMSSKRKKAQSENHGSNRNLDGRRLRTVNEAKALAEYLALKPDMDKKEKEERKKRWQQVLDIAETKQAALRTGSKGKIDGRWVEEKDEASERTRDAVLATMHSGSYRDNLQHYSTSPGVQPCVTAQCSTPKHEFNGGSTFSARDSESNTGTRAFAGFDDDDEYMSGTESESSAANDS